jgi:hypothetical protein
MGRGIEEWRPLLHLAAVHLRAARAAAGEISRPPSLPRLDALSDRTLNR